MEISVHRMSVLLAVHRAGGIVAAGDTLNLSPSAVSQHIKLLEKETQVRVLDRTPTGAVLTEAGRVLAEAAERIEEELATARRDLSELDTSAPTGRLRVGSFATAIRALLLPLREQLQEEMPGLQLTIEEVEERQGLTRLRRGELDMVLIERDTHTLAPAPRGMADVPVLDESWLVIVPPDQPAPNTMADLIRATWIDLEPTTAGAFALERLSQQLGTPLTRQHVAYDYDVVMAMVSGGLGYALLPELAVRSTTIPDGVSVARLPGLGVRHLVVRHRLGRHDPSHGVRAVLEAMVVQATGMEVG